MEVVDLAGAFACIIVPERVNDSSVDQLSYYKDFCGVVCQRVCCIVQAMCLPCRG